MKNIRRFISMLLALTLCVCLTTPALAGGEPNPHGGPCYIVNDMYYPLDIDDAGDGWHYTAATRTLTIESLACETLGLYAYYEAENLYIEMVGDSVCAGSVRTECYPLEDDVDGGAIIFCGDGSLTVEGHLSGPKHRFYSGTVTTGDVSGGYGVTPIEVYDGATVNIGSVYAVCSFVVYGGTLNFETTSGRMSAMNKTYLVYAGEVNLTNPDGYNAMQIDPEAYEQLIACGAVITSADGEETIHYTEGSVNAVRLASDPESYLSAVRIAGTGTPLAPPARPTVEGGTGTDTGDGDGDGTDTGGLPGGVYTDEQLMAAAEEMGIDLSQYSPEEREAVLDELAAALGVERASGAEPEPELAIANTQTVLVDGEQVVFEVYMLEDENGGQTNYIKLRDLAYILNGTVAQFDVGWDGSVNLLSHTAYSGGRVETPFSGDRAYTRPASVTNVDGVPTDFDCIMLTDDAGGGHTYYKLRDLGRALGFNVGWSAELGIFLETDKPYGGEA